ncbi:hypothetical protein RHGRI_028240 [Rhododendron griersonianum]|uniref:Cyclic nucleotide-binding domain-containing protein n=1 Tax=Rhododendron griersonianum TaxID=479676 RepID=A0AAV6IH68_9ERIC|nr:hypothetical protein RHGRI_028240 [Rhododendron griersonianum]
MMNRIISRPASHLRHRLLRRQSHRHHHHLASSISSLWRHRQILDPNGDVVTQWNHVFLVTCLVALFIDPLYFFLPYVGGAACMTTDTALGVAITFFRTLADLFYLLHMIVIWIVIPATRDSSADYANNTLALIVLLQYIPRLFLIFPLNQRIIKTTGVIAKTAWAGAAYNLLLYILASHVLGASWYLLSIGRQNSCWKQECFHEKYSVPACVLNYLDCNSLEQPQRSRWVNATRVISRCDAKNDDSDFKFGMFADAFTSQVASSGFIEKYLYCLWWGLRNLSSYGQNLDTSTYLGETSFCIIICIGGLILFAQLIGQMQFHNAAENRKEPMRLTVLVLINLHMLTYLSSMTVRLEEWRVKRRDTEEWMRHRQLPPALQERVRRFVQYKWLATRGVNEESILQSLPIDLRREIQRHLCLKLVRRVPFFAQMDDQLLDAICERLVLSLSTQGTYISREGDPVNEMLFIIRGQLESSTTNGGRSGFFNSITLRPGDFCGEELLTWALMPNPSINLPSSTRTVRTLSEVEAFALRSEDLKYVGNQFKRLHSKKLQHAFRYYSHQWRTWGGCYIQAAWRRYKKKKLAKELALQESSFYDMEADENNDDNGNHGLGQHLGATFLASKFAKNTRKGVVNNQKAQVVDSASSLKMPKFFKPDEPDFSVMREEDV